LQEVGIRPYRLRVPPVIGEVMPEGAAARAGVRPGDEILSADGQPVMSWEQWVEYVQSRPEQTIRTEVLRGDKHLAIELRPDRVRAEERDIGRIGASVRVPEEMGQELRGIEQYSPFSALGQAVRKTWEVSVLTLKMLKRIILGTASVQNISGPLSIAQYAGQSAGLGLAAFLAFLGIVSVSLGVFNLLPVPVLDGGHLLYYLVEFVIRRPVPETVQRIGQQIGIVILGGLMIMAFYNDLMRILQ